MLAAGFKPDVISSDVHVISIKGPAFDLLHTLGKFIALGMTLPEVVTCATVNAARAGGVPGRERGLVAGERADFVLFDFDARSKTIQVKATYVSGRNVWSL